MGTVRRGALHADTNLTGHFAASRRQSICRRDARDRHVRKDTGAGTLQAELAER
jgi:hypothetical protein